MHPNSRQLALAIASTVTLGVTVTAFGTGPLWPLVPLVVLLLVGVVGGVAANRWMDVACMAAGGALGVVAAGAWQAALVESVGDSVWRSPLWQALNIAPAVAAGTLLAAVGGATFVVGLRFAGWKRLLASVGTGLLIAAAWVAVVGGSFRPSIDGYYIVDQDRIVVVTSGASQGWTRVTEVVESQADVHITVTSQEWLHSSGAASLERLELIVQLADPLAGRTVRDGAGRAVLELHTP